MTDTNEKLQLQPTNVDLSQLDDLTPAASRPQNIDPHDMAGTEDIGADEVRLPRLGIAQGLSPQMIPGDPSYIEGLGMFSMFNDVTGEVYGRGPLTVVPVLRHVTRLEFDPLNQKVVLDRDIPANDPRMKWTRGTGKDGQDEPPRATEYVEFVCMLLRQGKQPEPIVVSIKTTNKEQRKAAEMWTTFVKLRGLAIYTGMYSVSTGVGKGKTKEGQETTYGVFVVKNAGFIPTSKVVDGKMVPNPAGQALLAAAKQFHESLSGKVISVAREPGDDSFDAAALEGQTKTTSEM